eukprot:COSAG06_NODE_594_length_13939_cov_45.080202_4_plen_148_part_00
MFVPSLSWQNDRCSKLAFIYIILRCVFQPSFSRLIFFIVLSFHYLQYMYPDLNSLCCVCARRWVGATRRCGCLTVRLLRLFKMLRLVRIQRVRKTPSKTPVLCASKNHPHILPYHFALQFMISPRQARDKHWEMLIVLITKGVVCRC